MLNANELIASVIGTPAEEKPQTNEIPVERLVRRRNGILYRLKEIEQLELNPLEVFVKVATHAARLQLTMENDLKRPKQGFILFGGVGCGKTTLVRRAFAKSRLPFFSALRILSDAAEYADSFRADRRMFSGSDLILDDLGAERADVKRYGTTLDLTDWLSWRYDCYQRRGVLTFITTNAASGKEIEQRYGARIASRIQEMCEVIRYDHTDRRRLR